MPSLPRIFRNVLRASSRSRRGSVLLLVVAVLVLMAILGTSYLQVARVQRLGIQEFEGDIDAVMNSVLIRIENQLRDDLLDEDARLFNQGAGPNDSGYDEPYDFAWTNFAAAGTRSVERKLTAGTVTPAGGRHDDFWLASSQPEFGGTNAWPQITSLAGVYVANSTGNSDLSADSTANDWQELVVNNGNPDDPNSNQGMALTYTGSLDKLVDADGDGMGDSRWEFPPITQIGGVIYVSAVRIVDLGSMANAEAGMSLRDDNGNFDPFFDAPAFEHPGELDFHGFMRAVLGTPQNGTLTPSPELGELKAMLEHKLDLASPPGDALVALGDRQAYWLDATRRYGPFGTGVANAVTGTPQYADYANADEWALRRRGGLADGTADGTLEPQLTSFLGATANPAALANDADAQAHYDGPRPHVTVSSGIGVFAPRLAADGNAPQWKLDVNEASNAELRDAIVAVMNEGASFALPAGFGNVPNATNATNFADQFVACLRDYADADNVLTEYTGFYGMERLPAIAEVYVQRRYIATETANGNFDTEGDDTDYEMDWDAVGDTGFLVEIRNPWKRPISLTNVRLQVDGTAFGADLAALPGAPASAELGPNEVLVLHKPSNGGGGDNVIYDGSASDLVADEAGFTYIDVDLSGEDWPSAPNRTLNNPGGATEEGEFDTGTIAGSITVALEASTTAASPNDWLAYQRVNAVTVPDQYQQREMDLTGTPDNTEGYAAARTAGNADSLNMLLVTEAEWEATRVALDTPAFDNLGGVDDRDVAANTLGAVGGVNKGGAGTAPATPINPAAEQMVIADDRDGDFLDDTNGDGIDDVAGSDGNTGDEVSDPIPHVGELLLVTALAPTGPGMTPADATVAEVWADVATPTTLAEYRLDIGIDGSSPALVSASTGHGNDAIPHAAMLLERLAVSSPRADGVDNDGDGTIDETTEAFVPGRINLNTASRRVLESMIPIPDETMRSALATDIINRRTTPGRTVNGNTVSGIAHLSELVNDAEALMVGDGDTNTLNDGNDDIEIDFLADPATGTAPNAGMGLGSGADGVVDDAEERARVLSWLYEMTATRSDAYVAYVLVHGYKSGKVDDGPIESKRVIALFNRSGVEDNSGGVLQAVFVVD